MATTTLEQPGDSALLSAPPVPRALDVDSHEMVPVNLRDEIFGPTAFQRVIREQIAPNMPKDHPNRTRRDMTADDTPINFESVWMLKGGSAPSAIDLARRPEVLDLQGIDRQLCYPTFGLTGLLLMTDKNVHEFWHLSEPLANSWELGLETVEAHNRWAARMTKSTDARVRPVGMIVPGTVEEMMAQT